MTPSFFRASTCRAITVAATTEGFVVAESVKKIDAGQATPLDQAALHETVDPPGDAARREVQPARELTHADRAVGGLREEHEHLVVAQAQGVGGLGRLG